MQYIYPSLDDFLKGKQPDIIRMSVRKGKTRLFRKIGEDRYIDHKTLKRKKGEYKYSILTYKDIMRLPGTVIEMLNPGLTIKMRMALEGKYELPSIVGEIIDRVKCRWYNPEGSELEY